MKRGLASHRVCVFLGSVVTLAVVLWLQPGMGHAIEQGQGAGTPSGNGDVNGDGKIDISDAVYLLSNLFLGGEVPVAIECLPPGHLPPDGPLGNGDVNGDRAIDISDAVHLLAGLFLGGPAPVTIQCQPPSSGAALPATGQTKCYGAAGEEIPCDSGTCPGQDGFYQAGCPMEGRFVDNGDGTVTDNCTGLMWQKDTAEVNGELFAYWPTALQYCEALHLAGYDDWRLPNVRELLSVVDYGRYGGAEAIDQAAINPVFGALPNFYWSSSSLPSFGPVGFGVDFAHGAAGYTSGGDMSGRMSVRAVRGISNLPATGQSVCRDGNQNEIPCDNPDYPGQDGAYQAGCPMEGRFVDNGDGTVTDNCTALMWQKDTVDPRDGGDVVFDCNLAGHDDWRLPNIRELESIVDYGRVGPTIDPVLGSVSALYCSSSSYAINSVRVGIWCISFDNGLFWVAIDGDGGNFFLFRAVRNAP